MAEANTTILEAGASEGSLSPNGGTAHGDIKMKTIADIVAMLGTKSDEDLNGFKASLAQIGHEADSIGGNSGNMASIKSSGALKTVVKEDLEKIFGGQDTLSEEFMDSATTLFEAAVSTRVALEVEGIEEEFESRLDEAREDFATKSIARLDTYLDYMAEKFMEENAVAIENGIRLELAESFLTGMKDLFESHNVTIDAEKLDVVKALEEQVADLHSRLNEAVDENARVANEIEEREISQVVNTVSEGMIETDKQRLLTIAENIDYSDVEDFTKKLDIIKSTFFPVSSITEGLDTNGLVLEEVQPVSETGEVLTESTPAPKPVVADARMDAVLAAIKRQVR